MAVAGRDKRLLAQLEVFFPHEKKKKRETFFSFLKHSVVVSFNSLSNQYYHLEMNQATFKSESNFSAENKRRAQVLGVVAVRRSDHEKTH